MKIGNRDIGYGQPTFVIAEACSNITRYLDDLPIFIQTVAKTGADAMKCQLFLPEHFPEAERSSKYQTMFPRPLFKDFVTISHDNGLLCGASVFDDEAIDLCVNCGADYLKLATREWDNNNLYHKCLYTNLPIIRSFDIKSGPYAGIFDLKKRSRMLFMACVPDYPAHNPKIPMSFDQRYMLLDLDTNPEWGWSSHLDNPDSIDCLIAVSRGACVIERHFKLGQNDYEAGWSLDPQQFAQMIADIRRVEIMR